MLNYRLSILKKLFYSKQPAFNFDLIFILILFQASHDSEEEQRELCLALDDKLAAH